MRCFLGVPARLVDCSIGMKKQQAWSQSRIIQQLQPQLTCARAACLCGLSGLLSAQAQAAPPLDQYNELLRICEMHSDLASVHKVREEGKTHTTRTPHRLTQPAHHTAAAGA